MFRRSLLINAVFSLASTYVMMTAMPTSAEVWKSASAGISAFAENSVLLSPLIHRVIRPN